MHTSMTAFAPRVQPMLPIDAAAAGLDPHGPAPTPQTVLLVEDDDRVRGLLATVLRKRGYTVLEAERGDIALATAEAHPGPIHLLLSDVVMPGINGRVVAAKMAQLRPATRVLLMSGYSDDVVQGGIEPSKTPFIQKPFSMEALATKIRETLGGSPLA